MEDQDNIEVDLKEPEKKGTENEPEIEIKEPEKKAEKKETLSAENGIKKLQDQLQKEKQARIVAEYSAKQNAEKAVRLETEVQETQKGTIDNAIEFTRAERITLRQKLAAASAAGDHEAVAEITEAMSDISAKLLNLENGKQALSERPKPRAAEPTDVVEAFASQMKAPSAAWIRAHPDYVTDVKKNKKMLAAHSMALADDLEADTPEYFASIEKTLGLDKKEAEEVEDDATSEAAKPVAKRASPPAAPVSRSMGSDGKKINIVTLSREEVETAEMMGMTKEDYARNKQKLISEGRMGRSN